MIVVIDLDDTLIETFPGVSIASVLAALKRVREEGLIPDEEFERWTSELNTNTVSSVQFQALKSQILNVLGDKAPRFSAYERAEPVHFAKVDPALDNALRQIKDKGALIAVLTKGDVSRQTRKYLEAGLNTPVDGFCVITGGGAAYSKRDYIASLTKLYREQDIFVIGDNPIDEIAAALGLSVPALRVKRGEHAHVETPDGALEFGQTEEAVDYIINALSRTS